MSYVFISYSRSNSAYTYNLVKDLQENGFDVWIDKRIKTGDDWHKAIVEALRGCDAFIVIMTPESEKSEWVSDEMAIARALYKPTFPILLEGDDNVVQSDQWALLIRTQFEDLRNKDLPSSDFYDRLSQFVERKDSEKGSFLAEDLLVDRTVATEFLPIEIYNISSRFTTIGRHESNKIQINRRTISRFHAKIEFHDKQHILYDQNSCAGTFVNQKAINEPVELKSGDLIGLGYDAELVFIADKTTQLKLIRLANVEANSTLEDTTIPHDKRGTILGKNEFAILTILGGTQKGELYSLSGNSAFMIGRQANCQIILRDKNVSRLHAIIVRKGEVFAIRDFDSTNGTFLNGERVRQETNLANKDVIKLGDIDFIYEIRQMPQGSNDAFPTQSMK